MARKATTHRPLPKTSSAVKPLVEPAQSQRSSKVHALRNTKMEAKRSTISQATSERHFVMILRPSSTMPNSPARSAHRENNIKFSAHLSPMVTALFGPLPVFHSSWAAVDKQVGPGLRSRASLHYAGVGKNRNLSQSPDNQGGEKEKAND